jgi:extracellular factor (EF) 3-hydroxypalmitic acid methyl ester biosynthesis protein
MNTILLNEAYENIASNRVLEGMEGLFNGLRDLRHSLDNTDWMSWVQTDALRHPLRRQIHSDPFTNRSFSKPRGYSGDGVLIDMVYRHKCVDMKAVTHVGREIYEFTSNVPAAKAVRNRREHIASLIDKVAEEKDEAAVMAIACGHLRECELSSTVRQRRLGRYVAIDQDPKNLAVIHRDYSAWGITGRESSLRDIVAGNFNGEKFDLIYTAGLYDYLPNPIAKKLTSILFGMLSPGGTLFVANFLPDIRDAGYMECYMAWTLIYRSQDEMLDLIGEVARDQIDYLDVVTEEEENIAFMTVGRREQDIPW